MGRIDFLESSAAGELLSGPSGPERDPWLAKLVQVQCVAALGRRDLRHALKMLGEQASNLGARQIVDSYLHRSVAERYSHAGRMRTESDTRIGSGRLPALRCSGLLALSLKEVGTIDAEICAALNGGLHAHYVGNTFLRVLKDPNFSPICQQTHLFDFWR